jgi:ATP-dependent RNA helicase DeaD
LAERNFDRLTPVQTASWPTTPPAATSWFRRRPAPARTVAYGLALANNLLDGAERFERAAAPLALIVAPTRELALQVHRELAWLYQYADARVVSCVGGMDPRREQRELAAAPTSWSARPGGSAIICGAAGSMFRN